MQTCASGVSAENTRKRAAGRACSSASRSSGSSSCGTCKFQTLSKFTPPYVTRYFLYQEKRTSHTAVADDLVRGGQRLLCVQRQAGRHMMVMGYCCHSPAYQPQGPPSGGPDLQAAQRVVSPLPWPYSSAPWCCRGRFSRLHPLRCAAGSIPIHTVNGGILTDAVAISACSLS